MAGPVERDRRVEGRTRVEEQELAAGDEDAFLRA
jgi:hypothetical protein